MFLQSPRANSSRENSLMDENVIQDGSQTIGYLRIITQSRLSFYEQHLSHLDMAFGSDKPVIV